MPLQKWLNYMGVVCGCAVLFVAGFYFGFKTSQTQNQLPPSPISKVDPATAVQVTAKEVPGVFWIKPGMPPNCPPEYQIKGRFDTTAHAYYTKESKSYGRIKPDICFATEEAARDTAGFIKRF